MRVDRLDVVLRAAGKLVVEAGINWRALTLRTLIARNTVGTEPSTSLIARLLGISLPLTPNANDSAGSSASSSVPFFSMILTNASSWWWPLLGSSMPSWPARRRSRMIWSIGATPFGQASTQLKQWVQS